MSSSHSNADIDHTGPTTSERLERDVTELRVPEPGADVERALIRLGMALPIVGLVLVGVAWYGASGTGYVADQIPYLISGGVGGLGLLLIGVGLFLRYSITHLIRFGVARMVHEQQAQADRIVEALGSLEQAIRGGSTTLPATPSHSDPGTPRVPTTSGL